MRIPERCCVVLQFSQHTVRCAELSRAISPSKDFETATDNQIPLYEQIVAHATFLPRKMAKLDNIPTSGNHSL